MVTTQLEQARAAAGTLRDLERQANALPRLEQQARIADLRARGDAQLQQAETAAANLLAVAGDKLRVFREAFVETLPTIRNLATMLRDSQRDIQTASATLAEGARAAAYGKHAAVLEDPDADHRFAVVEASYEMANTWGQTWAQLNGPELLAFPDGDDPDQLEIALAHLLIASTELADIYHPGNVINPLRKQR